LNERGYAHYYFFKYYSLIGNMRTAKYHKRKAMAMLPKDSELRKGLQAEKEQGS